MLKITKDTITPFLNVVEKNIGGGEVSIVASKWDAMFNINAAELQNDGGTGFVYDEETRETTQITVPPRPFMWLSTAARLDIERIEHTENVLNGIAAIGEEDVKDHFLKREGPRGKWPPLSPITIEKRRQKSDVPLRDTGQLFNSIHAEIRRS